MVGPDVDDVMQSAYLRAFRGWSEFQARSTSATWLYRIAVNTAIDHLRGRRRSAAVAARAWRVRPHADVATVATDAVDLLRAVDLLPIDQRVVLILVDGQGFSHEEAAETLRVPVGTIGSRLSRARHAVRAALERGPDDER